ncbi:MAG: ethanolamine ammonia-lyase subunit EutC [Bryobacteraceae bacterium]|nr:ethanolamine ammonia-lyase subunit EutC [Bryobacteraceae bacterium]
MANDLLASLRGLTDARIALDRTGVSMAACDWLALRAAHAEARDAVNAPVSWPAIAPPVNFVRSLCRDRAEYLLRPDLGRRLVDGAILPDGRHEIALIVADGLSPLAVMRHAPAMVELLRRELTISPVVLAELGRVAIGDEIGERLGAKLSIVLIGERPGLSAADSLGAYLTYSPRVGRTDAERNCISNIRDGGLDYDEGSRRIVALARAALDRGLTGVELKEGDLRLA